jgi:hypothetical protein
MGGQDDILFWGAKIVGNMTSALGWAKIKLFNFEFNSLIKMSIFLAGH